MAGKNTMGGTPHKRKDGRWGISVSDGKHPDGRRKTKSFYGNSKQEVVRKYERWKQDKKDGIVCDRAYDFVEWSNIWFENHKDNISATTQEGYKYTLRILQAYFGNREIADIKPIDIEQFLKKLRREGRSDSALAGCRGMLYQVFHKAEANDLIRKNPVRFAGKMRSQGSQKEKEAFTEDEVRLLMKHLPENLIGWSVRLMLGTGMRTQEVLALEPHHISIDGSVIQIRQAVKRIRGSVDVGLPKSAASVRDVPVPESLRDCAVNLRKTDKTYVWELTVENQPANPSTFRKYYDAELKKIPGVRLLSPHSCRHTYVSQMQALGVDMATIQSMVGHADMQMTGHYLHVQNSIRQEAIGRFEEKFGVKAE